MKVLPVSISQDPPVSSGQAQHSSSTTQVPKAHPASQGPTSQGPTSQGPTSQNPTSQQWQTVKYKHALGENWWELDVDLNGSLRNALDNDRENAAKAMRNSFRVFKHYHRGRVAKALLKYS